MQLSVPELRVDLKRGQPVSAIPRRSLQYIFDVLRYLTVKNGTITVRKNKWTIDFTRAASVHWSGRVFFGGQLVYNGNPSSWVNTHVKVNLETGSVTGEDWDEQDAGELNQFEYYSVATKSQTEDEDGNPVDVYTLNNNTVGDIRCRIT